MKKLLSIVLVFILALSTATAVNAAEIKDIFCVNEEQEGVQVETPETSPRGESTLSVDESVALTAKTPASLASGNRTTLTLELTLTATASKGQIIIPLETLDSRLA